MHVHPVDGICYASCYFKKTIRLQPCPFNYLHSYMVTHPSSWLLTQLHMHTMGLMQLKSITMLPSPHTQLHSYTFIDYTSSNRLVNPHAPQAIFSICLSSYTVTQLHIHYSGPHASCCSILLQPGLFHLCSYTVTHPIGW